VNLTKKTISVGSWKFTAVACQGIIQILVLAVLARYILPEEFGIVAIATIVTAFATMFSEAGLGSALIQKSQLSSDHIRVSFTVSILMAIFFYLLLYLFSDLIATFFQEPSVSEVLKVLGLIFIFKGVGGTARSLLIRDLNFKSLMIAELGAYLIGYALISLSFAFLGYGVWAIVFAILAHSALLSFFFFILHPHNILPSLLLEPFKDLLYFGGGLTFSRTFHFIGNYADNFIVGKFLGASALGIYGRAYRLMEAPVHKLGNVIDNVMFPVMATIQDKTHRLGKGYLASIELSNLIMLPFSILMIILGHEVVFIILGPKWESATLPFQILMLSAFMKMSVRMSDSLVRAIGSVYYSAFFKSLYAVAALLGCWIGHFYGLPGVAAGVLGAVVFVNILMVNLGLRLTKNKWGNFFRALLPGSVIAIWVTVLIWPSVMIFRSMNFSGVIILFIAIFLYFILIIGLKLFFPKIIGATGNLLFEEMLFAARRSTLMVSIHSKLSRFNFFRR